MHAISMLLYLYGTNWIDRTLFAYICLDRDKLDIKRCDSVNEWKIEEYKEQNTYQLLYIDLSFDKSFDKYFNKIKSSFK